MSVRIMCINKAGGDHEDPHVAISHLGWIEDGTGNANRSTRIAMYDWINSGGLAYVRDAFGNAAYLVCRISAWGNPYVQTVADGVFADNLLYLPEC